MTLDLSILQKRPELSKSAILEIEPLAPLSMVSELPGSYYKTLKSPSKKMLSGLFENILEWHIDAADRNTLVKDLRKIRKQQGLNFSDTSGSSYIPLLAEYFEINLEVLPQMRHFDDYWSKAYRRTDEAVHALGTFNISYELIPLKRSLPRDEKKPKQVTAIALKEFFRKNLGQYPFYYSTPTKREFVLADGSYQIHLLMDHALYNLISKNMEIKNDAYLGTSEGWVNLKITGI